MHIELQRIRKTFGSLVANNDISTTFHPGRIYGLLGENGAGKSTLMKILSGALTPTSGTISIDRQPVRLSGPSHALRLGIGMLYQDPSDYPSMSVFDNFAIGWINPSRYHRKNLQKHFRQAANTLGFHLQSDNIVRDLTVGERQQLEIIRLLSLGCQTLILDEPTTGISPVQQEQLFRALRNLADEGKTVIIVSHKIQDIVRLCHAVLALNKGILTGARTAPFDPAELISLIFWEIAPSTIPPKVPLEPTHTPHHDSNLGINTPTAPAILTFQGVSAGGDRSGLKHCTVTIRKQEIIGLAGLEGSGQGSFLRLAAGLLPIHSGIIRFQGAPIRPKSYFRLKHKGISFLPAARLEEGLVNGLTIADHVLLNDTRSPIFRRPAQTIHHARQRIETFSIKGLPLSRIESLSGGNQQRLLLSLIPAHLKLLLLEQPTRGLDMASAQWVWSLLKQRQSNGVTLIFSSADLEELLNYADRIIVFFDGRIIMDTPAYGQDPQTIGQAIAGLADHTKFQQTHA